MERGFTVKVFRADEGGYWAEVPELPGCVTQGESIEKIRENIAEAIEGYLEVLAEKVAPGRKVSHARAVRTFHVELATV
jgi:predicted RNase H-like HicB family nuclease